MKTYLSVFLLLFISSIGFSQKPPKLVESFNYTGQNIEADQVGNLYISNKEELTQLNQKGEELNRYSNKQLGDISFLDISSPLKPLLFYKNLSQIVYLDNRLYPRSEQISLEQLGYPQATLVCSSYMNGLWIFDQVELSITRLDRTGAQTAKVINLNQVLGVELNPNFMYEKYNKLYLNDPKLGIYVFDVYGNFAKKIPLAGLPKFKIDNNLIYFPSNNDLVLYDQVGFTETRLKLPIGKLKDLYLSGNNLWLLTSDGLFHYLYQ